MMETHEHRFLAVRIRRARFRGVCPDCGFQGPVARKLATAEKRYWKAARAERREAAKVKGGERCGKTR